MNSSSRPTKGIFCPISEGHPGQIDTLLLPIASDAIFVRCNFHDWMRVELYQNGDKMTFDNISVHITPVALPNKSKGHYFNLEKLPCVAAGEFPNRKFRKKRTKNGISSSRHA